MGRLIRGVVGFGGHLGCTSPTSWTVERECTRQYKGKKECTVVD
jgi:hypothetical protein